MKKQYEVVEVLNCGDSNEISVSIISIADQTLIKWHLI